MKCLVKDVTMCFQEKIYGKALLFKKTNTAIKPIRFMETVIC